MKKWIIFLMFLVLLAMIIIHVIDLSRPVELGGDYGEATKYAYIVGGIWWFFFLNFTKVAWNIPDDVIQPFLIVIAIVWPILLIIIVTVGTIMVISELLRFIFTELLK